MIYRTDVGKLNYIMCTLALHKLLKVNNNGCTSVIILKSPFKIITLRHGLILS